MHVGLGTIGGIAFDDHLPGPRWGFELFEHVSKQGVLFSVIGMRFRQDDAKGDRNTLDVPGHDQQGKANPEKPIFMLGSATLLGKGVFLGAFGFMTAIANDIDRAIICRRQGSDDIVGEPCDEQVDTPITGFEQASQAPLGDLSWTPMSQVLQGFPSRIDGLHDNQPAQNQSVVAFPHTGHASKHGGDERRQVGQLEHRLSP